MKSNPKMEQVGAALWRQLWWTAVPYQALQQEELESCTLQPYPSADIGSITPAPPDALVNPVFSTSH